MYVWKICVYDIPTQIPSVYTSLRFAHWESLEMRIHMRTTSTGPGHRSIVNSRALHHDADSWAWFWGTEMWLPEWGSDDVLPEMPDGPNQSRWLVIHIG